MYYYDVCIINNMFVICIIKAHFHVTNKFYSQRFSVFEFLHQHNHKT